MHADKHDEQPIFIGRSIVAAEGEYVVAGHSFAVEHVGQLKWGRNCSELHH
jgi:hypothetical protein